MAKFKFYVSTGYVGSSKEEIIEIDDEDLEDRTEDEIADIVNEEFEEWVWNTIDSGWTKVS